MAKHDEWVSAGANRWMQMEAEHNARWAQLTYLDGPGYTIMDRIEAKMDLRRQYFSRSASHGVQNSIEKAPIQSCSSHFISSMTESNREHNSRVAESTREIRESCARILKLLQAEIEATKLTGEAVPTSDESVLSVERIEEHLLTDESVHVKNLIVTSVPLSIDSNGGIEDLIEETRQKRIDTPESFGGRKTDVKSPFVDSFCFEPLIVNSILKSFTRVTVVQRDCCRKETPLDMDNKKQSSSVVIPIVLPSPEPPDRVVIPTSPLLARYYPYDPGPISSPPLTNVSYPHYSFQFQFEYEEVTWNPSQYDKEIVPQIITMLIKKSTHEAGVVACVFHLPIPMWSIVIPISSVDVLFGYDIRTSVAYTNIETSCEPHYLFVKTPLKTNFSCDTVKSLVCEVQIHASFVHAEIARSDTLELVMFLLYTKLSVVSFVNTIMELRIMRLPIMDGNPSYANPAVNASNDLNLVIVNTDDGLGKLGFFKHDCTYYWLSGIMVLGTYGIITHQIDTSAQFSLPAHRPLPKPPSKPPYRNCNTENATWQSDSTSVAITKMTPTQSKVTTESWSQLQFIENIMKSNCTRIKGFMVDDVKAEDSNMAIHLFKVTDEMSKISGGCFDFMFVGFITTSIWDGKELLAYVFVPKCCPIVVKQFIYGVFDLMKWISRCGFVYGMVMFKQRGTSPCLRFVLIPSGVILQISWSIHHYSLLLELEGGRDESHEIVETNSAFGLSCMLVEKDCCNHLYFDKDLSFAYHLISVGQQGISYFVCQSSIHDDRLLTRLTKTCLNEEANERSLRFTLVGSIYHTLVLGICQTCRISEAFNWKHAMVDNGVDPNVAKYSIFLHISYDMGNMGLFMIDFTQMIVMECHSSRHMIHDGIMIHGGIGLNLTIRLYVVVIVPNAKEWYTTTSLIPTYNAKEITFSTIFAAMRQLLCTNSSSILIATDVWTITFEFGLRHSHLNLWALQFHQWDPG